MQQQQFALLLGERFGLRSVYSRKCSATIYFLFYLFTLLTISLMLAMQDYIANKVIASKINLRCS